MNLFEGVLFGSEDLSLIRKVFNQSGLKGINYNGLDDKQKKQIDRVIKYVKNNTLGKNNANDYCLLMALTGGADTSSNKMLAYAIKAPRKSWDSPDKVLLSIELIGSNKIGYNTECLYNDSIYSDRTTEDYRYTVMAFDAVTNRKEKYFDGKDSVNVTMSPKKAVEFFDKSVVGGDSSEWEGPMFGEDGGFVGESLLTEAPKERYSTYTVPISVKYLYKDKSGNGKIIPAGVNQTSSSRTIWNYMELWSNPSDETTEQKAEKESSRREDNRNRTVDKIKNILKNSNVDDKSAEAINDLLDLL